MKARTRILEQNPPAPRVPLLARSIATAEPLRREAILLRLQRSIGNRAIQRLLRSSHSRFAYPISAATLSTLQRDSEKAKPPSQTTVRVDETGKNSVTKLNQGKGGSGAIVYDYSAH